MFKKISTAFMLSFVITSMTAMVLTSIPNVVAALAGTGINTSVTTIRGTDGADLSTLTASNIYNGTIRINQPSILVTDTAKVELASSTIVAGGNNNQLRTNTLILRPEPITNPATIAAVKFGSETQHLTFTKAVKIDLAVNPAFNDKIVNVKVKHEGQKEFNTDGLQDANGKAESKFKVANNTVQFYSVGASTFIVNLEEPVQANVVEPLVPVEHKTKIPATVIPLKIVEEITPSEITPNIISKVLAPTDICPASPNDLACPDGDNDGDGKINSVDPYPSNACLPNSNSDTCDLDKDGVPNSQDLDDDGDGSNDTVEIGDVNGDGILDAYQVSVVSIINAKREKQTILFDGEGSCAIPLNVYNIPESALPKQDPLHTYSSGFTGFKMKCSGTTTVTVLLPGKDPKDFKTFVKATNKIPGDYNTFDFVEITKYDVKVNGINGYQYYVSDGQIGDDSGFDGNIEDPGGVQDPPPTVSVVKVWVNPVTTYDETTDLSFKIVLVNKGEVPVDEVYIQDDLFAGDPNIVITACDNGFQAPFNKGTVYFKKGELDVYGKTVSVTCNAKALKASTKAIKNTVTLTYAQGVFHVVEPEGALKQSDGNVNGILDIVKDSITAEPKPIVVVPPVPTPPPIPTPIPTPQPIPVPQPIPAPTTCCNSCCSSCCNSGCCNTGMNYNSIDNKNNIVIKNDAWGYIPTYNMNNIFGSDFDNAGGVVKFTFKPVTNNYYK
jgi:hypothetical protein